MRIIPSKKLKFDEPTDVVLTDPCYLWFDNEEEWLKIVKLMHDSKSKPTLSDCGLIESETNGKVLYCRTANGDGTFDVDVDYEIMDKVEGGSLGVDAGIIGVAKLEDVANPDDVNTDIQMILRNFTGTIIVSPDEYTLKVYWRGTNSFRPDVFIDTDC